MFVLMPWKGVFQVKFQRCSHVVCPVSGEKMSGPWGPFNGWSESNMHEIKLAIFRKSLPFQELGLVPQHQKRCPETFRKQHR